MSKASLRVVAACLLAAATTACATVSPAGSGPAQGSLAEAPVRTEQGLVRGVPGKVAGVTVFKGIPFAAPPVGALRWAQPASPEPWTGVREASRYGDVCVQSPAPQRFPPNSATDIAETFTGMSEDCLTLNVWTPAKHGGEKLPVMVWLYGGAYSEGGGNAPFSEGDHLAAKGVVLVTFNYRVGAFGFFSHPELTAQSPHGASGNQALGDAIAVFRWLKANVAGFGGDPDNITIFGESAGAAMDGGLAGSPVARGTFERAISESGAWMGLGIAPMVTRESAEARTLEAAGKIGATSLAALRALPADEVAKNFRGQGMIVDGWIIPEDLTVTFAEGRQNPVDVLAGSNTDEGSFTAGFGPPTTAAAWPGRAQQQWGDLAPLGLAAYPAATDAEAAKVATMPFSDAMSWHMRLFAESAQKVGRNGWHYWFAHRPPYDPGRTDLGAGHTAEIPYVFDNLAAPRTYPGGSSVSLMAGDPREEAFADLVSQYWVNFARTGDPNGAGLPVWPRVDALGPTEAMILDAARSGKGMWLTPEQIDLYTRLYRRDVLGPLTGD